MPKVLVVETETKLTAIQTEIKDMENQGHNFRDSEYLNILYQEEAEFRNNRSS